MTPTIDQIEAALPYVPAGLHCGDLTEPDERREFAEVIHGIVVEATETAPESRQDAATGSSAQSPQNDPPTPHRRNNGVSIWGPPDPGAKCYMHCTHWTEAGEECCDCKRIIPEHELFMPWCPGKPPPPTPTDMSIAWGITEALIEEAE